MGKRRKNEKKTPKARILIVDDDESIRKVLTEILTEKGYHVEAVENGRKAILRTKHRFYNLALIDIRLPDIQGVELITKMHDTSPKMVKVIITGYPTLQNAIDALNRGADAYLIKPLDIEKTLKIIEEHLQKQKEMQKMTEKQLVEFIETRAKMLEQEIHTK